MASSIEKRIAEERCQRSHLKLESLTKRKIAELQNFILSHETNAPSLPLSEPADKAIAALKLENKVQKETIEALKSKVEEVAAEARRAQTAHSQALERTLAENQLKLDQKSAQIAELVESKRQLSQQLEELTNKYLQLDQSAFEKLESLKQRFQDDLRKARLDWEAQSQVRFKDWKEKTRRQLKESTIKGLEPEIDRILKKGELEKEQLKSHFEELLRSQEEGSQRKVAQLAQLEKERLAAESQTLLERQRALLADGFEKEAQLLRRAHELETAASNKAAERERKAFESLKAAELAGLKERLERCQTELKEVKAAFEERLKAVQREAELRSSERLATLQRDHTQAQLELKARLESQAEERCQEKLRRGLEELEKRQREEVAMLVDRFAAEAAVAECRKCLAKGSQADHERVEALRNKLKESEQEKAYLKQKLSILAEKSESHKLERSQLEAEAMRLREAQGVAQAEAQSLRVRLRASEEELETLRLSAEERLREMGRLKGELFEARSHAESVKLSSEQSLKSYYERELESQQRKFETELDGLQGRVAEAMAVKDRAAEELRAELALKKSLIGKFEEALEQQRRDFMGIK